MTPGEEKVLNEGADGLCRFTAEVVYEDGVEVSRTVLSQQIVEDAKYRVVLRGRWETCWDQPFVNVSVLEGAGALDGEPVKKGDHFIIPAGYGKMVLEGELELIYSHL